MLTQYNLHYNNVTALDTCSSTYLSVCHEGLGEAYENKIIAPIFFSRAYDLQSASEKMQAEKDGALTTYIRSLKTELIEIHKEVLKKYLMRSSFSETWKDYLSELVSAAEMSALAELKLGYCGEATRLSIVQSLINQIETGKRETIQIVTLFKERSKANHAFALYNAKPLLSSVTLADKDDFSNFIKQLEPDNLNSPVIICDSWVGFHGLASRWLSHFDNSKANYLANTFWAQMNIKNYSIPSFRGERDEYNADKRYQFKHLMLDILKRKFDYLGTAEELRDPSLRP